MSAGGLNTTGHFLYSNGNTISNTYTQGISSFYYGTAIGVAGPDYIESYNGKNISPPLYYQGDMAEIIVFNFAMDSTQVAAVANYLSNKWLGTTSLASVTNLLPATTPLVLNAGGTLDLSAANQTLASLSDGPQGGGTITNSGRAARPDHLRQQQHDLFRFHPERPDQPDLPHPERSRDADAGGREHLHRIDRDSRRRADGRATGQRRPAKLDGHRRGNSASQLLIDGGTLRYTGSGAADRLLRSGP